MENLVNQGLCKSIGVSNFNVQTLYDLLSYCEIKPVVNEIELHPYLVQHELVRFMKDEGIVPIAYCPLARAGQTSRGASKAIFEEEIIKQISSENKITPGQVVLRWGIE